MFEPVSPVASGAKPRLSPEDGAAISSDLVVPVLRDLRGPGRSAGANNTLVREMAEIFQASPTMAAFIAANPAFLPLLAAVCTCPLGAPKEGAVVPSHPDQGLKFSELTAPQGAALGASLSPLLASKPAGEAVGEWIGNSPALKTLDKEEAWFRLLIKGVGKEVQEIEKSMLKV
jgi:hypothetical protein